MRYKEFIVEKTVGKIKKRQQQSTRGLHTYRDGERANSDYVEYRLGLALACSNGKDPINVDSKSWYGKRKLALPYTDEEQEMLKQAYEVVGASWEDLNNGDLESEELKSTNTVSPISNWMTKK